MLFPTLIARRKLGITYRNIKRVMLEMEAADKDALGEPAAIIAATVLNRLVSENESVLKEPGIDWGNIDWDAILTFIEEIVELVLRIIALFA